MVCEKQAHGLTVVADGDLNFNPSFAFELEQSSVESCSSKLEVKRPTELSQSLPLLRSKWPKWEGKGLYS
jgi:hypothetical protein